MPRGSFSALRADSLFFFYAVINLMVSGTKVYNCHKHFLTSVSSSRAASIRRLRKPYALENLCAFSDRRIEAVCLVLLFCFIRLNCFNISSVISGLSSSYLIVRAAAFSNSSSSSLVNSAFNSLLSLSGSDAVRADIIRTVFFSLSLHPTQTWHPLY